MVYRVVGYHPKVADFNALKKRISENASMRERHSATNFEFMRTLDNPEEVVLVADLPSLEEAKAFQKELQELDKREPVDSEPARFVIREQLDWE